MSVLQKTRASAATLAAVFLTCFIASGQDDPPVNRVLMKDGKVKVEQGGTTSDLEKDITLPNEVRVTTNGTYTVKEGKERKLLEGQALDATGMLTSPDGSIVPVFDHILLKNGRPVITKDGESSPLATDTTLGDGNRITPTGYLVSRDGRPQRLMDGQIYRLDGKSVAAKDTISLRNGKVVVQKDGSLFSVPPDRSLMMNDGTKVFGDGTVVYRDGNAKKLTEGELITLEGVARK